MGDGHEDLARALDMARALYDAAEEVARLAYGGAAVNYYSIDGSGRSADKAVAVREWIGTTRDHFEDVLYRNEVESVQATERGLRNEADAWAGFWAAETNARNDRAYDIEYESYRQRSAEHQADVNAYEAAMASPEPLPFALPSPGSEPTAPTRPPAAITPLPPYYSERFAG